MISKALLMHYTLYLVYTYIYVQTCINIEILIKMKFIRPQGAKPNTANNQTTTKKV